METIREKALKIKRLAESGCEGEKITAIKALENLMAKYKLTPADLEEETRTTCYFHTHNSREESILCCIFVKVSGIEFEKIEAWEREGTAGIGLKLTKAQEIEVREWFDVLIKAYRIEVRRVMDATQSAFVNKHGIALESKGERGKSDLDMHMVMDLMFRMNDVNLPRKKLAAPAERLAI
jgi:hypothetical protein